LEFRNALKSIVVDLVIHIISDIISILFHEQFVMLLTAQSPDIISQILGIIAAGAIASAAIFGYKIYTKLKGPIKETAVNVYHRRNIKLEDFLKKSKKEIYIFGITLEETLSGEYDETFKKLLKSKDIERIRFLISNPDNSQLVKLMTELVDTDITTISSSLNRIKEFRAKLGEEKEKLEIRIFDGIPVQSIFILDPESKKGIMRYEPYLYGIQKGRRRLYELRKKKDKLLFEACYESCCRRLV
jgi:hypothetical protein